MISGYIVMHLEIFLFALFTYTFFRAGRTNIVSCVECKTFIDPVVWYAQWMGDTFSSFINVSFSAKYRKQFSISIECLSVFYKVLTRKEFSSEARRKMLHSGSSTASYVKWMETILETPKTRQICMQITKPHPKSKELYFRLIYLILFVYPPFPFLEMFPVVKEVN